MAARRTGFTTRASCLLAAGITAVLCGLLLGEVDLVRAGVLAAAVPCISALVVQRSQVRIANRRSIEPSRVSAGEAVTIHLVISNRSMLRTGTLMLEDQLPDRLVGRARFVLDPLGAHEARTVSYRIPGLGRGRYRTGPLRIRLSDPFGMIDLTRSFTATSDFVVAPVIDQLPAIDPPRTDDLGESAGSHSVGTHGADDQSTREYRIGDDLRKIHWRSSARMGALMVRQEERPWRGQTTVLLDLRGGAHASAPAELATGLEPRLTSSLKWAVSAAASIGSHALLAGREVSLLADPTGERIRFGEPGQLSASLATVHETSAPDLNSMAGSLRTAARDSSVIAILGRLDPTSLRILADAHPRGRSSPAVALLLDVDTWRQPPVGTAEHPGAGAPEGPPNEPVRGPIDAAAAVLINAGWRVSIVRCGDSTPRAWQMLLAGFGSTSRIPAVLR